MKKVFFWLFTLASYFVHAQQKESVMPGNISGRVVDSLSKQAVEYATISLMNSGSEKVVNGATTDNRGAFTITDVQEGNYKLVIYFIGYKKKVLNNVVMNKAHAGVALGDIRLASNTTTLNEVVVTGEKSVIENRIDKLVYNVDKDVTSQTGVAADVLKKVPEVSVDVDGNVELQGNANIRFLINGKPSVVFGNDITDVLQSIPASRIQSIEVITSPGAKYDAEGTGGIINIILKKSSAEGVNGNISLSAGSRLENGSVNIGVHHTNFGISGYISGNGQLTSTTLLSMNRTALDNAALKYDNLVQNGTYNFNRQGYQSGISVDWDVSPTDNITASFGIHYYGYNGNGINYRTFVTSDFSGNTISSLNDAALTTNKFHTQPLDGSLYYKKKFKQKDRELELSYITSTSRNYADYNQSERYIVPDSVYSASYGNNPGTSSETDIAVDYTQPLAGDAMLEAGAKTEIDDETSTSNVYMLNNISDVYTYNPTQSSSLDYKSTIYAAYASVKFRMFGWLDVKAGFRDEYTHPHAFFSNAGDVNVQSYNTYVPSAMIAHTFSKNQTLKLSYTHRIQRPGYRDLDPFINASDPKNLTTGNPALLPEIGDKIEMGYNKTFDKGTVFTATLFYRGNRDDIQTYTTYYPTFVVGDSTYTNVSVATRQNVGREDNYGLSLFASVPATSKLNLRTNLSGFQRYITNGTLAGSNVHGFNYRINLNASYNVSKTLIVEVFGNFNSPRVNVQGTMPSFTTYSFALRKQFWNKKASFALTATNPFNEYVSQKTSLTGDNFTLTNLREVPYQSFGVNFTFKFGKIEFKKEKEHEDMNGPPEE